MTTLLFAATARAESPLSLETVLQSVARTHPGLEAAQRKVESAEGKQFAARGGFDPTFTIRGKWNPVGYYDNGQVDTLVRQATPVWGVGLYAGYRVGWGSYPVYKGDLQTLSGGEVRAGIDVPVWRNGPIDARRAKIRQTRIRSEGARRTRDATALGLELRATKAYWSWAAAGLRLQVARELLAIAQQRDTGLAEQAAAGAIEPIKRVDSRRLVLDRKAKVVAAQRKFNEATLALSLFLRDAKGNPIQPGEGRVPAAIAEPTPIDTVPIDQEVTEAIARRPDVAALLAKRSVTEVGVKLARNQRAPAVNVQSFVARDFGNGPAELGPTEWGVGVVVEMPLPLRAARGQYRAAKADLRTVDAEVRGLRDAIGAEVRASLVAVRAAEQTVVLARQQVLAANELAEAERERLTEGASELVIVNLRELAAADAATQEIDALADFQRARADFLVSTGRSPQP
ncbi:MAG: TolC family protein [Deltaproteobacteria bacterium]|nr:TolC family protein [Deltaproteobacteria bacterium]